MKKIKEQDNANISEGYNSYKNKFLVITNNKNKILVSLDKYSIKKNVNILNHIRYKKNVKIQIFHKKNINNQFFYFYSSSKKTINNLNSKPERIAVLNIVPFCNQNCIFCSEGERKNKNFISLIEVKKVITRLINEQKIDSIIFMGGEITLRKDLKEILEFINLNNINITLSTNGIKFSNRNFSEEIIPLIDSINISFHAHNKGLYKKITNKDNFKDIIKSLENIKEINENIFIKFNLVINSENYKSLSKIVKTIEGLGFKNYYIYFKYILVQGRVKKNTKLVPRFSQIKEYVKDSFDYCKQKNILFIFEGIPFCLVPDYFMYSRDNLFHPLNFSSICMDNSTITGHENFEEHISSRGGYHSSICNTCLLLYACPGIRGDYKDIYDTSELSAIDNIKLM